MIRYNIKLKKLKKKLIKEDDFDEGLNKHNETVLEKQITKIIKKNKSKPIDTSLLIKSEIK